MTRLDALMARASVEYQIAATLIAAGVKPKDGSKIEVVTPEEHRDEFDLRLQQPLNTDRLRAALLKEVRA